MRSTDVTANGRAVFDGVDRTKPAEALDSRIVADLGGTRVVDDEEAGSETPAKSRPRWGRRILIGLVAAAVIGLGLRFGVPFVREMLETVATDDAFVAGHVTYVSPRIEDVVTQVLVDQNDRVEPGQLLVQLDRQPFELAVAQNEASLEQARANVLQARAQVQSQIAQARAAYYQRKNAQETLRRQIATLSAQVATLKSRQASLALAQNNFRRGQELMPSGGISKEEADQRDNALKVAVEQEKEAWAAIQETRATLGLAPDYKDPMKVPKELEVQQSTVQTAVSNISSSLAQVGIPFDPKDAEQAKAFGDFLRPEGDRSAGEGLESVIEQAPAVRVAQAAVARAEKQLDDARLRLSWTEVRSEVAGYVQDRQVHPGNRVQPGQTLLSIRPSYVWIDANYKETQLHDIRIGMPVDLYVDAYPGRVFKGRVAGFSPGTGLSESLLPPENATGNYVKVTQRLPVRIELAEPNPDDTPLFVGLSVVPRVRFQERPTGPGAGERLHAFGRLRPPDNGAGPAGLRPSNLERERKPVKP
jgi:membrane fusion protein, multidrug efflux system